MRGGGLLAQESPDGKWLYFSVAGGVIRRMLVDGGEETDFVGDLGGPRVTLELPPFGVTGKGIYYRQTRRTIGYAGGESRIIGSIPRAPAPGLSVSADGQYLLFAVRPIGRRNSAGGKFPLSSLMLASG
jgi:WD40-like Beta Propeller Repeat